MNTKQIVSCPIDNRRCYIHHDKDTGFELRCRHGSHIDQDPMCLFEDGVDPEIQLQSKGEIKI
jgi:hypothetical protein